MINSFIFICFDSLLSFSDQGDPGPTGPPGKPGDEVSSCKGRVKRDFPNSVPSSIPLLMIIINNSNVKI